MYNEGLVGGVYHFIENKGDTPKIMTTEMLHSKIFTLIGENLETEEELKAVKKENKIWQQNRLEVKIQTKDRRTPKDSNGDKINNHFDLDFSQYSDYKLLKNTCIYEQQRFSRLFPDMDVTVSHYALNTISGGTWMHMAEARESGWVVH